MQKKKVTTIKILFLFHLFVFLAISFNIHTQLLLLLLLFLKIGKQKIHNQKPYAITNLFQFEKINNLCYSNISYIVSIFLFKYN